MNLPTIAESATLLGNEYEFLLPVAPTLNSDYVGQVLAHSAANIPNLHLVPDALPALAHSRAGIVASGTATVEAALMETPFVMVYRVTPLTYLLGRSTVKVPHFAMVNLIAEKRIVPEFVQHDFTSEKVASALKEIIPNGQPREQMLEGLREVRRRLRGTVGDQPAPVRAAEAIAEFVTRR